MIAAPAVLGAAPVARGTEPTKTEHAAPSAGRPPAAAQPAPAGREAADAAAETNVRRSAETLNKALASSGRHLEFVVDDATRQIVVKLVDTVSGDVVRQVPSEQVLALARRMETQEGLRGALVDVEA